MKDGARDELPQERGHSSGHQTVQESLGKLYISALFITTISIFRPTLSVLGPPILYLNTLHFFASNYPLSSYSVLTFLSFNFPFFYKCHSSLQFSLLYCIFKYSLICFLFPLLSVLFTSFPPPPHSIFSFLLFFLSSFQSITFLILHCCPLFPVFPFLSVSVSSSLNLHVFFPLSSSLSLPLFFIVYSILIYWESS